jgi:very-short-patch-repair endonuclease
MVYNRKSSSLKMNQGANPILFERARALRKSETEAEAVLWEAIRSRKLNGVKFRRQHPFFKYILDFYCHEHQLAIEVDGGIHLKAEIMLNDQERESDLKELGLRVLRFTNEQVLNDLDFVLRIIKQYICST